MNAQRIFLFFSFSFSLSLCLSLPVPESVLIVVSCILTESSSVRERSGLQSSVGGQVFGGIIFFSDFLLK